MMEEVHPTDPDREGLQRRLDVLIGKGGVGSGVGVDGIGRRWA